jgi:hypothetical protein
MGQTELHFLSDPMSDRIFFFSPMQLIFFVPPNEELEGTLHPQKFGCTPKNEGKKVHVPPDEKTCGHAAHTKFKTYCMIMLLNARLPIYEQEYGI